MENKFIALKIASFFQNTIFFAPVALLIRTRQGLTYSEFLFLQSVLSFGICFTEIPSGFFADRFGYRKCLQISSVFILLSRITLTVATSFSIFFIETIFEIFGFVLASGTIEAYISQFIKEEKLNIVLSEINNCSTIGFIFSTIAYAFLFTKGGITLLLYSTVVFSTIATVFYFILPKDPIQSNKATVSPESEKSSVLFFKHFVNNKSIKIIIMSSSLSLGGLLVNFFYIEKLINLGIPELWMTIVILFYSALYLLIPSILKHFQGGKKSVLWKVALFSTTACFFILGNKKFEYVVLTLTVMILLPFFIQLLEFLLYEQQMIWIKNEGCDKKMASAFSYFSIFNDVIEFLFLIIASSLNLSQSYLLYGATAILVLVGGCLLLYDKRV